MRVKFLLFAVEIGKMLSLRKFSRLPKVSAIGAIEREQTPILHFDFLNWPIQVCKLLASQNVSYSSTRTSDRIVPLSFLTEDEKVMKETGWSR